MIKNNYISLTSEKQSLILSLEGINYVVFQDKQIAIGFKDKREFQFACNTVEDCVKHHTDLTAYIFEGTADE